jgi:hypothetical protein
LNLVLDAMREAKKNKKDEYYSKMDVEVESV